jgi:hypothetical protein
MKLNVKALNECLGIDGPVWIEDNPDNYEEISKHIPVCNPPIHSGESHHMKKEKYKKRVSEKLKGENNPQWGKPLSEETKIKMSLKLKQYIGEKNSTAQWWKITFDDGREITMCGLSNWCKENGYSKGHISKIYHKQRKRHRDIVTVEKLAQTPSQQTQETL